YIRVTMTNIILPFRPRAKAHAMSEAPLVDKHPLARVLPPSEKRRILPLFRHRAVARGERVWSEGEAASELTFVVRGRVKLVRAIESGRDAVLDVILAGELLCVCPTFAHVPLCCTSIAMEETEVVSLRRIDVLDLIEQHPIAAKELVREMSTRTMGLC